MSYGVIPGEVIDGITAIPGRVHVQSLLQFKDDNTCGRTWREFYYEYYTEEEIKKFIHSTNILDTVRHCSMCNPDQDEIEYWKNEKDTWKMKMRDFGVTEWDPTIRF